MPIVRLCALALALGAPGAAAQSAPELRLPQQLDQSLRDFGEAMKPALDTLRLLGTIDAIEHYGTPELLPNGDILIRRDRDAPPLDTPKPPTPGLRT